MSIPEPQIIRSHRSSLTLHVGPGGEVIVKAPFLVPNFVIKRFIKEKEEWIKRSIEKLEARKPAQKKYVEGEEFLFLGKTYHLKLHSGTHIVLRDNFLLLPKASLFRAQKELAAWYMQQAREVISSRVELHAKEMKATYTGLLFSDTKSKWGTCFADNFLQFNFRLIMTPLMVLDYVVIHELTHTTEKNHSDAFWRKVRLYTPAYKQHRKWLNDNAQLLTV